MIRALRRQLWQLILLTILGVLAIALMLPIAFTLFYSFFPKSEMSAYLGAMDNYSAERWLPILISPRQATLRQYYTILIEDPTYLYQFINSAIYAGGILAGQLVVVPSMAFALSCFRFKGREFLFFVILVLMLMPFQVTMTPTVITLQFMNLMNTRWAVILPMWFSPFYMFLLRQYMVGVPPELMEAGMIDGAGPLRCYLHIMLPAVRPILGAAVALSFADNWNMVEQPLVYLQNMADQPLSVMFNTLTENNKEIAFAGASLYIVPMLVMYFYFQEDILLGVQLSELK